MTVRQTELPEADFTEALIDRYAEGIVQKRRTADMAILNRLKGLVQKTKLHFELQDHLHEGAGENPLEASRAVRKLRIFAKLTSPEHPRIVRQKLSEIANRLARRPALEFVVEIYRRRGPARTFVFFFKATPD